MAILKRRASGLDVFEGTPALTVEGAERVRAFFADSFRAEYARIHQGAATQVRRLIIPDNPIGIFTGRFAPFHGWRTMLACGPSNYEAIPWHWGLPKRDEEASLEGAA